MLRKWQLFILVALAAVISSAITLVGGEAPDWAIYRNLSTVVATLGFVVLIYDRWLWRVPKLYPALVATPNIRGTWKAVTDVVDLDPERTGTFHGFVVVQQTHSHITYTIFWDDGEVSKMADEAPLSAKKGMCAFAATYRLLPGGRPRDFGMYFYWAPEMPDTVTLRYRTNAQETGEIVLSNRRMELCTSYADAKGKATRRVGAWDRVWFELRWS
jgi:hypothetical protein